LKHWYYQAKFDLLRWHLLRTPTGGGPRTIADLGCGLGVFLTLLERSGIAPASHLQGVDPAQGQGSTAIDGGAPISPSWPENQLYHWVLLMDVLEHVEDDVGLLVEARDHCRTGGCLFVTVPAFQWMFAEHDRCLGHKRRYTLGSLRMLAARAGGLTIEALHYYFGLLLPFAFVKRRLGGICAGRKESDLRPLRPCLNSLFRLVMSFEHLWGHANRLGGLTAVMVCRKRSD